MEALGPAQSVASQSSEPGSDASSPTAVEVVPLEVPRTEQFPLTSETNGVGYQIAVALPNSYVASERSYPLLLLLDAHYSFLIARNIVDHLGERDDLPELVIAGIGYEGPVDRASASYRGNRTRDYTPTRVPTGGYGAEYQEHSGGGPSFLAFLGDELIPHLESRYRLTADRTLVGHSYGGLFAVSALLARPELFDRLIAVSPSLWYDDRVLFEREAQLAAGRRRLDARIYLGVGAREGSSRNDMVGDLERMAAQLDARAYEGLAVRAEVLDGETHNSVFPRALSNGLRFVFESR